MTDSTTSRIAGLGDAKWLPIWVMSIVFILLGATIPSLLLIGIGSVALFGSIAWLEMSSSVSALGEFLVLVAAVYLVSGGFYFDTDLLKWAGILLIILHHVVWSNRTEFRERIRGGGRNDD
ncbi:MAG TPA: hypothetical protein VFJ06_06615 [Halococcus sp.]|nr:hypothetical protein [Halococcus sp.]